VASIIRAGGVEHRRDYRGQELDLIPWVTEVGVFVLPQRIAGYLYDLAVILDDTVAGLSSK
jgi:hypothetical protein